MKGIPRDFCSERRNIWISVTVEPSVGMFGAAFSRYAVDESETKLYVMYTFIQFFISYPKGVIFPPSYSDSLNFITSVSAVPPSTLSPTTANVVPTTTTTTAQTCVSGWSAWINKDNPDTGDGDMEKMTSSELTSFCPGGTITQVDCQTVDGIEHFSSGEILTCTTDGGLQCNNADNFPIPCSDYRIKYECTCPGEHC